MMSPGTQLAIYSATNTMLHENHPIANATITNTTHFCNTDIVFLIFLIIFIIVAIIIIAYICRDW